MDALAKQGGVSVKSWLQRWRFTNDGVFMVHETMNDMCEYHAADGSVGNFADGEKVFN